MRIQSRRDGRAGDERRHSPGIDRVRREDVRELPAHEEELSGRMELAVGRSARRRDHRVEERQHPGAGVDAKDRYAAGVVVRHVRERRGLRGAAREREEERNRRTEQEDLLHRVLRVVHMADISSLPRRTAGA